MVKLAAIDPSNAVWQCNLAVSYGQLGDLAKMAGNRNQAREEFTAGLKIGEQLVALDPTNAHLAEGSGSVSSAASGTPLAVGQTSIEQLLKIIQELAASDPGNAEWQRDLSVSCVIMK